MGEVDPRACGVNGSAHTAATALGGRSPRMRGKHANYTKHLWKLRSIPAHAG